MILRCFAACAAVMVALTCGVTALPERASAAVAVQSRDDLKTQRAMQRAAADAGDAEAQWTLGMMLLNGEGGPADPVEARRYVRMAAEQGLLEGQISMAVMLALGQGGPVDAVQARVWYGRAAEQGSAHALRGLGMMLVVGEGGPEEPDLGRAYLEMAFEAGDENAAILIGVFDREGFPFSRAAVDKAKADWIARRGRPTL